MLVGRFWSVHISSVFSLLSGFHFTDQDERNNTLPQAGKNCRKFWFVFMNWFFSFFAVQIWTKSIQVIEQCEIAIQTKKLICLLTVAKEKMEQNTFYYFVFFQWEKHRKIHDRLKALWKIFWMRLCWLSPLFLFRNGTRIKKRWSQVYKLKWKKLQLFVES